MVGFMALINPYFVKFMVISWHTFNRVFIALKNSLFSWDGELLNSLFLWGTSSYCHEKAMKHTKIMPFFNGISMHFNVLISPKNTTVP